MAGFRKAKGRQAAIKMAVYGPAGSGKTFTSLLVAEGLGTFTGTRVAYVDTEQGTHFYSSEPPPDADVPKRKVHPEPFDFDVLETRSLFEVNKEVRGLKPSEHGVIVIDSVTHLWEAAIAAYRGRKGAGGQIPFHAWGSIKKPYKDLMSFLLGCKQHVILCGRQGGIYEDDGNGEIKHAGYKMKAEGETPYEPHILIRMDRGNIAHIEKDRTGVLMGQTFHEPGFVDLAAPILPLLGCEQAPPPSTDDAAIHDAEAYEEQDHAGSKRSTELLEEYTSRFKLAKTAEELEAIAKTLTTEIKSQMRRDDLAELRTAYLDRSERVGP